MTPPHADSTQEPASNADAQTLAAELATLQAVYIRFTSALVPEETDFKRANGALGKVIRFALPQVVAAPGVTDADRKSSTIHILLMQTQELLRKLNWYQELVKEYKPAVGVSEDVDGGSEDTDAGSKDVDRRDHDLEKLADRHSECTDLFLSVLVKLYEHAAGK
jgi:hypothetical protein